MSRCSPDHIDAGRFRAYRWVLGLLFSVFLVKIMDVLRVVPSTIQNSYLKGFSHTRDPIQGVSVKTVRITILGYDIKVRSGKSPAEVFRALRRQELNRRL